MRPMQKDSILGHYGIPSVDDWQADSFEMMDVWLEKCFWKALEVGGGHSRSISIEI